MSQIICLITYSGIGPREHLEDCGVEVVRDLPGVGSNLVSAPFILISVSILT